MDEAYKANLQQRAAALGLVAVSLQQFSSLLNGGAGVRLRKVEI